jgi:hypothetical protein
VGEAAREDDEVGAGRQLTISVPNHSGRPSAGLADCARDVTLAIRTREDDDGGTHQSISIR